MDSMPMLSPRGAIQPGGVGVMTLGIGTMVGTGILAGEAGASVGDGMILGITIIIILIGAITRIIITTIMVPFGLVEVVTSVVVGVMVSTMTTVVGLQTVPMLYAVTVVMIAVCGLLVVMTVVQRLLRAVILPVVHRGVWWLAEIRMKRYALQVVTVDSPLEMPCRPMDVPVVIR